MPDEIYSLTPFRSSDWKPGLYFAVGSYYTESPALEGRVYCELMMSSTYGKSWTRLAPHKQFIPHSVDDGRNGTGWPTGWDSHTCYSANGVVEHAGAGARGGGSTVRFYYAGGNGPHSGGGNEHGRRNGMGLATATTDALAGLRPPAGRPSATVWTAPVLVPPLAAESPSSSSSPEGLWVLVAPEDCAQLSVQLFRPAAEAAISGFERGGCVAAAVTGALDAPVRHSVQWSPRKRLQSLAAVAGTTVVLRLELRGTMYAFGFAP